MKKQLIIIALLIIVVIVGILIARKIMNDFKIEPTVSNKVINHNVNSVKNEISNTVSNETNNENANNTENTTIENTEPEKPKTELEKAIDIVKQDWGEDNNVYYAEDGKTAKGEYIICVRDKNSTNALAWYTVNIAEETFVKER